MDPKGKVALVTGAANGLGLAISKELLQQGVKGVAVCDINVTKGKKVVEEMQKDFGHDRVIFIRTDVTKEDEQKEAFSETVKKFGTLDIVINNAGVIGDKHWQKTVATNINGVIEGTLLALEYMGIDRRGNGGVVVNMSSLAGIEGIPVTPVYNATKQAIIGLSRSFGSEYFMKTTGVRVMTICPGFTTTESSDEVELGDSVTVREEWMTEFFKQLEKHGAPQKAENVSNGVLQMIREGPNGSVWVCANDEPIYQIKIPAYQSLRV